MENAGGRRGSQGIDLKTLTGKRKAAILLVSLGPVEQAGILRSLSDDQIETLTLEIANLGKVQPELKREVIEEFAQLMRANEYISQGGMDFAKSMLERALGSPRALDILNKLQGSLRATPFDFIRETDPGQMVNLIKDEHPQTIALILAHLEPRMGAQILSALPQEIKCDVVMRVANMDRTSPEVVREVEKVLERKMAAVFSQDYTFVGGSQDVAEMLNLVDRGTEKSIMGMIEEQNPELAEEIKKLMFVFEDILTLDDAAIQKFLRETDNKDLSLALKAASDEVKDKIFANMSERARTIIEEEMDFMGPVRLKTVEEAQQKIVAILRRLEQEGEIIISRGGSIEDELIQ